MPKPILKSFSAIISIIVPIFVLANLLSGCGSQTNPLVSMTISPSTIQVRAGDSSTFTVTAPGGAAHGGAWSITGTGSHGSISPTGVYTAPIDGNTSPLTIVYTQNGFSAQASVTVLNPAPTVASVSPGALSGLTTTLTISGTHFFPESVLLCDGKPVSARFIDASHIAADIPLPASAATQVKLSVQNPNPGSLTSAALAVPVKLGALAVTAPSPTLRMGESEQLTATLSGAPVTGGTWAITGSPVAGAIGQDGHYTAPVGTSPGTVVASFSLNGSTASTSLSILNPLPRLSGTVPAVISGLNQVVALEGSDFVPGSSLLVDGKPVATTFTDSGHLTAQVSVGSEALNSVTLTVSNPDPGSAISNALNVKVALSPLQITPSSINVGQYAIKAALKGLPSGATITVDGKPISPTSSESDTVAGTGWLVPWRTGTVHVTIVGPDGSSVLAEADEPITPTAVSFDAAARFSKQAGFGPRPDIVLHIQQIGFKAFLQEQFAEPVNDFHPDTTGPIRAMYLSATTGSSLLRLRTAWGLQTFMPGLTVDAINPLVVPWEQTLEKDAFTNYRTILRDTMNDPNIGTRLTLPGNMFSTDPNYHPNQNFGRELMQLFSLGMYKLNPDGTQQLDPTGATISPYSQDDVIAMSRVFTGWNYGPAVNPLFTRFGIDYSQPLVANESLHDTGAKSLFGGTVNIPAGLSASDDREKVLDALMSNLNIGPFVSRLLIQRFVTSQPSPQYVSRVAAVFRDNGSGVSGDMKSIITAILLDPEARAGDDGGSQTVGFLQDPITSQMFMLSALQISGEDDQPNYLPLVLGEGVFNPPTIFGYFSPSFIIPATQINSPEFELYNNFTAIQRMQAILGVSTLSQPGYNNGYGGWLYDNFHTPADMLEAVNHLLLSGQMPQQEQTEVLNYANTIQDSRYQLESIVFLALNSDNYIVVQ